jgi:hypothetical protein
MSYCWTLTCRQCGENFGSYPKRGRNSSAVYPRFCGMACYRADQAVETQTRRARKAKESAVAEAATPEKPKTIRVPAYFYIDHLERDLDTPADLGSSKTHAIIAVDDPHLGELLDDAEHYAHPSGPDACGRGLIMSAKATVRAIRNVIGWDDAEPAIKRLRKEATR